MTEDAKGSPKASKLPQVLAGVGVCIKDSEFRVLEQNDVCIQVCGHEVGQQCKKGCSEFKSDEKEAITKAVIVSGDQNFVDCILIDDGKFITTMQFPDFEKNKTLMQELNSIGLTKSELVIAIQKLQGWSNQEICDKLFISMSTLKTHLNHIYQKTSDELRKKLQSTSS